MGGAATRVHVRADYQRQRKCAFDREDESACELYVSLRYKPGSARGPGASRSGLLSGSLAAHHAQLRHGYGLSTGAWPVQKFYTAHDGDPDRTSVHGCGKARKVLLRSSTGELNAISTSSFRVAVDTFMGLFPSWSCPDSHLPSAQGSFGDYGRR